MRLPPPPWRGGDDSRSVSTLESIIMDWLNWKWGGAHAPPSPNFQTGIPSFLALSPRLAEMPEPGNTMTPIGRTSRIRSLRLNGAALAWRVQSGLKTICGTLRVSAQQAAIRSAPLGLPPCLTTMSGGLAGAL